MSNKTVRVYSTGKHEVLDEESYYEMYVKRLHENAKLPRRAHSGDLGYDLYSTSDVVIEPGKTEMIDTGIVIQLSEGFGSIIKDRSSMAIKGIVTAAGVIDNGYRGEVKVVLRNTTEQPFKVEVGDKIAQLIPTRIYPFEVEETDDLSDTIRSEGGFGSTGRK